MHDVPRFGLILLLVADALLASMVISRFSARFAVPGPAIFLLLAAGTASAFGSLHGLSVLADQRIVTVALALILFDGGMHIGLRRLRPIMAGVAWLGTAGTLATAAATAAAAHGLLGSAGASRCCWARRWRRPIPPWCSRCSAAERSPDEPARCWKASPGRTIRWGSR